MLFQCAGLKRKLTATIIERKKENLVGLKFSAVLSIKFHIMYSIYNGLNLSNHGLIEALVLTDEPQISNYLVRTLIHFSIRRALGKCFPKNTATVRKSESQRKVLGFLF